MDALVAEAEKTAEAPDGGLDSAAKVQAKLNMFAAYEDELKGREGGVGKLTDLVNQARYRGDKGEVSRRYREISPTSQPGGRGVGVGLRLGLVSGIWS